VVTGRSWVTVTGIEAIGKENSIPGTCRVGLDLRLVPTLSWQQALADIERVIAEFVAGEAYLGGATVEPPRITNLARPFSLDPAEPISLYLQRAAQDVLGQAPSSQGSIGGGGGSRWICLDAGVPIVSYGIGNNSGHSTAEHVRVQDYLDTARIYANLALMTLV
jgi:acetylornithine deacetylase/succinyl-diaminopimelate desuccinylase-like protein